MSTALFKQHVYFLSNENSFDDILLPIIGSYCHTLFCDRIQCDVCKRTDKNDIWNKQLYHFIEHALYYVHFHIYLSNNLSDKQMASIEQFNIDAGMKLSACKFIWRTQPRSPRRRRKGKKNGTKSKRCSLFGIYSFQNENFEKRIIN